MLCNSGKFYLANIVFFKEFPSLLLFLLEKTLNFSHTLYIQSICGSLTPDRSMAKEKIINLRVDSDLKRKAKKLAEQDGRSLSNWITWLIEREIRKSKKGA